MKELENHSLKPEHRLHVSVAHACCHLPSWLHLLSLSTSLSLLQVVLLVCYCL
ncbi:hypothetical protein BVRB_1g009790 [Beta vulgaris subsp. vulgaris]|nr:hypothetical protein BVRB_1g009790 [Beta vulgaris subsp. vulgaris]